MIDRCRFGVPGTPLDPKAALRSDRRDRRYNNADEHPCGRRKHLVVS